MARWEAVVLAALCAVAAVVDAEPGVRRLAPGPQYQASGFHRAMLGSSYRDLWATPIEVEILDLEHEAGGLKVVRRVGGQQTLGLALAGADGRSYTFRGLDKDPSNILPDELQDTFVEDVVRDQMSAQHPAGALIADELARAVGIATVPIRLVVLPDDPALGEYRATFAGLIGTFAEYPTAADARHPGHDGAVAIVDHATLFARLAASPDDRVAVREFLKARLFDLLISDFDRHRKQWRWARREGNGLWYPIPEDRDQAFARYEGLLVRAAAGYVPQLRVFGPEYDRIHGLTWNGRDQDRWLLPALSRRDFQAVAEELAARLTDEVVDRAARRMPPEWYALDGARLTAALKRRRDTLARAADRFYRHLAGQVDVQATDVPEQVRVRRLADGAMEVQVSRRDDDAAVSPFFSRRFVPNETEEVRLYLRGGDDQVRVEGAGGTIRLRVIGGAGADVVDADGGGVVLHDAEGASEVSGATLDDRAYEPPPGSAQAPWIPPRDWGRDWFGLPWASYGSDYGVFVGGGLARRSYGFRQHPYASQQVLRFGWAVEANQPKIAYAGEFRRANSRLVLGLDAEFSGLEVLRYYGFGNQTLSARRLDSYKLRQRALTVSPTLTVPIDGRLDLTLAPVLHYSRTEEGTRLIDEQRPYGYGSFGQAGGWARLRLDTRKPLARASGASLQLPLRGEAGAYPVSGLAVEATGAFFPKAWDVEEAYGWVEGQAATYLTAGSAGRATLALRAGGRHLLGSAYPFHSAATVGGGSLFSGQDAVRGLPQSRFIGDSSAYGNAELRLYLSRFFLALPGEWGLFGFGDAGRVWYQGESSETWHTGWGGGLWVGLLSRSNAVAFTVARSEGRTAVYLRAGFSY